VAAKVATCVSDRVWGGVSLSLMREIQIMRRLENHPQIVKMLDVLTDEKGLPVIIMEYCSSSLGQLLQSDDHPLVVGEVRKC
jgi:serine/threonine protein kinase